jgi:hypothetical protein
MADCILHTGRVDTDGYGRVYVYAPDGSRKNRRAHRVEYEKHHGQIPPVSSSSIRVTSDDA